MMQKETVVSSATTSSVSTKRDLGKKKFWQRMKRKKNSVEKNLGMGDLLEFDSRIKKKSKQHNLHSHQKFIIWQRFHSHPYTLTKWFFSLPIAPFRPPGRRTRCVCALLSFDIHIFIVTAKWSSPLFGFWDSSHILGNYLLLLHRVAYVLLVSCWFFSAVFFFGAHWNEILVIVLYICSHS